MAVGDGDDDDDVVDDDDDDDYGHYGDDVDDFDCSWWH